MYNSRFGGNERLFPLLVLAMMSDSDNYFIKYHSLVLNRILQGQTQLYPHQQQALLAIYQKACRGEMDGHQREAALILAGVGTRRFPNLPTVSPKFMCIASLSPQPPYLLAGYLFYQKA